MEGGLDALREKLGAAVPDELLQLALTHPSAVGDGQDRTLHSNQRLEFLGDTVLSTVVAEHLYDAHADLPEGVLTQRKAAAVRGSSLAAAARRMGLPAYLILGRGEENTGRERYSIGADAFEAVVAAVYLAGGLQAARDFVLRALAKELAEVAHNALNAKNLLQERTQAVGLGTPRYQTAPVGDAVRTRTYTSQVVVGGQVHGRGSGRTKKEAEFGAAAAALASMAEPGIATADL
jgi:ribonuclease-3